MATKKSNDDLRLVYIALKKHIAGAWPSELAATTGMSKHRVKVALEKLRYLDRAFWSGHFWYCPSRKNQDPSFAETMLDEAWDFIEANHPESDWPTEMRLHRRILQSLESPEKES